jgi:hypothetical protein
MSDHHPEIANGKVYVTNKWLLGILASLVLLMGGYILTSTINRVDAKDATQDTELEALKQAAAENAKQIAVILQIIKPSVPASFAEPNLNLP